MIGLGLAVSWTLFVFFAYISPYLLMTTGAGHGTHWDTTGVWDGEYTRRSHGPKFELTWFFSDSHFLLCCSGETGQAIPLDHGRSTIQRTEYRQ